MKIIQGLHFLFVVTATMASLMAQPVSRPVESAVQTSQSVGARRQVTPQFRGGAAAGDTVPEMYPGENADIGPQYILLQKVRKTYFEAGLDVQYFYTSNLFLSEDADNDSILLSTAYAGLAPTFDVPGGQLTLRLGYRHQRFNYGRDGTEAQYNNLDFDVGTWYLSGRYQFAENWAASIGVDYNRYLSAEDNFNEFYAEAAPVVAIERRIPINDTNAISVAYIGTYHLTHTDPQPVTNVNDRLDTVLLITSLHELCPRVILQPYYRFQQTHYWENNDRNDIFNTFGVSLSYSFTDWGSVRVFTTYEVRDSDDRTVADYHKFDTGGGLAFAFRF